MTHKTGESEVRLEGKMRTTMFYLHNIVVIPKSEFQKSKAVPICGAREVP
jgi:hypothetical protein